MASLSSVRREKFVHGLLVGMPAAQAYVAAGYCRNTARACRLASRPTVVARLKELREEAALAAAARGAVMELTDLYVYLERVILTPCGLVHEGHELCQKYSKTTRGGETTVSVRMPNKLSAVERLIRLRGWYKMGKVTVEKEDTLGDLLRKIRGGGSPSS